MPIYEYRCKDCGEKFEHFVRSASEPRASCPRCDSAAVEKLPSAFAVGKARQSEPASTACCGLTSPCSDPKRCCQQ